MTQYLPTAPYRGTRDFPPEIMAVRTAIFDILFRTAETFGFTRYDGPILEPSAIYEAKSGNELANEQLYRLRDKAGRELALRPEMTPSVARMVAARANELAFPARWYSLVNCHRYEKPQRGRLREHWQLNVDIFGTDSLEAEVELFELIAAIFDGFGASRESYALRVNDRTLLEGALKYQVGVPEQRFKEVCLALDRWDKTGPDLARENLSKAGLTRLQIERIEQLFHSELDDFCAGMPDAVLRASSLVQILRDGMAEAPLVFDPMIIRALDYYTSTVFEAFDTASENRRSIFGGGRYDNLASLFCAQRIPGIGFGLGDVTLWNFLETHDLLPCPEAGPTVCLFMTQPEYRPRLRQLTRALRAERIACIPHFESRSVKKHLRWASGLGARFAVLLAENEVARGVVQLKDLTQREQWEVPFGRLVAEVSNRVGLDQR